MDERAWQRLFELDCSYTVDSVGSCGRFCKEVAIKIAEADESVARDKDKKIVADYRPKK